MRKFTIIILKVFIAKLNTGKHASNLAVKNGIIFKTFSLQNHHHQAHKYHHGWYTFVSSRCYLNYCLNIRKPYIEYLLISLLSLVITHITICFISKTFLCICFSLFVLDVSINFLSWLLCKLNFMLW